MKARKYEGSVKVKTTVSELSPFFRKLRAECMELSESTEIAAAEFQEWAKGKKGQGSSCSTKIWI